MSPRSAVRRVIPVPGGSGYAVVVDGAVVFIGDGDVVAQSVLDQVVRRAPDGRAALDRLAGLLSSTPALRYPGVAAVCDVSGGHELLVAGATEVAGNGPDGAGRWRAEGEGPRRHVTRTLDAVTLGAVDPRSLGGLGDLRRGTVACGGVVVIWSHGSDAVASDAGRGSRRVHRARPARVVSGVRCPAGHLDVPDARRCRACGAEIDPSPATRTFGLRPALGTLVFDSGDVFEIADDAVVGRFVDDDPRVVLGLATAIVPGGDTSALSRRHAWIVAQGWSLGVVDLGARNGTFVRRPGARGWEQLEPGRVAPLRAGDRLAFGRRTARIDAPHEFRTGGSDVASNQSPTTERSDHDPSR